MILDDSVCRGTLIISGGESYVVIGKGPVTTRLGQNHHTTWNVMPCDVFEPGHIKVNCVLRVWADEEVDMFFPGDVFTLPDYIK